MTRFFVHFPLNKWGLSFFGSSFFSLALFAQPNLYEWNEDLPWDQILPQNIKSIMVMDCENNRNDTAGKRYDLYEFDAWGKLLAITGYWKHNEMSGENYRYEYDSLGRLAIEFKDGHNNNRQPTVHYYYSFHYDEKGMLTNRYRYLGSRANAPKPIDSVAYHYDENHRLVKREYFSNDNNSRLWEMNFENGYGYDNMGRVIWRYGKSLNYPSDTTFIRYDKAGRLLTETLYEVVTIHDLQENVDLNDSDSTHESFYNNPKYYVTLPQRTTYVWNGTTCEITTRTEGLNPVDPAYTFQHNIAEYDGRGKIIAYGKKTKSEPRIWTRYFYTYYP